MKSAQNLDFNTVYFHSLGAFMADNRISDSLLKLESILKNGAILSRQEQINLNNNNPALSKYIQRYLDPLWAYNWNGLNHISICQKTSLNNPENESDAYKEYVNGNAGIGIILSPTVLTLADKDRPKLMDGEIQIKDKIPLDYMIGIFCGGKSTKEIQYEKNIAIELGYTKQQFQEFLPHILTPNQVEVCTSINNLLDKFGYNVPIYSTRDGYEININSIQELDLEREF